MSLKAGIIGLPNVGKSTLFNAITNSNVEAANYPFATIEPNFGIVELKDDRLEKLAQIVNPKKIVYATFEFIDIAGLVKGASKGEGLGNKFLSNIREVDAIIQVVRCFENNDITHVEGNVDPIRDVEIINFELLFADINTIENILRRIEKKALATKDVILMQELNLAKKLEKTFNEQKFAKDIFLDEKEFKLAKSWNLLTLKPMIYVGNVEEKNIACPENNKHYFNLKKFSENKNVLCLSISAQIEWEISQLDEDSKKFFLKDLNIKKSGLEILTRESFSLLNLATYFTVGVQEVRAWTFKKNMLAPECAGVIHSDFEKGFIKAEVISYEDYIKAGSEANAKNLGKFRLEGKDYLVKDGDIINFRFNV